MYNNEEPPLITILVWIFLFILIGLAIWIAIKPANGETTYEILPNSYVYQPRIVFRPLTPTLASLKIAKRIIYCESGGNPKAINRKSGAKGLFQVIPSSERYCEQGLGKQLDMFDPYDNIECANYLYNHGGLAHWKSSEICWKY